MTVECKDYLLAIGYIVDREASDYFACRWESPLGAPMPMSFAGPFQTEDEAFAACLDHSRSENGMVATHSAKEAWLLAMFRQKVLEKSLWQGRFFAHVVSYHYGEGSSLFEGDGDSPQAAVENLCQKVLEAQG